MPTKNMFSGVSSVFREALAVHAIYEAAGASADEIFIVPDAVAPEGAGGQVGVLVRQGKKTFMVTVGETSKEVVLRDWPRVVALWNQASPDVRRRLVEVSSIRGRAVEILAAMTLKGMKWSGGSRGRGGSC